MTPRVAVLGATGGFGGAVADALAAAERPFTVLARGSATVPARAGQRVVRGDARRAADLDAAVADADVVVHALNLPYPDWEPQMRTLTAGVVAAAQRAGATILLPGNVYGLRPDAERALDEGAPREAPTRKGQLRNDLEASLADATVPSIVLRAGDFFGGAGASSWMHHLTAKALRGGALQYPGALHVPHTWAYLPDLAQIALRVIDRRSALPHHAVLHVAGHEVDGERWASAVRGALGDPARAVAPFPWFWLGFMAPFSAMIRELRELRYLWDQRLALADDRLRALLGDLPATPFEQAVAQALAGAAR